MGKRYYWLKLPEDFFRQKKIKKLRKIAGGDTYTIIYQKMLLLAMKENGKLYFEGVEDDFCEEISLELDEDIENVKVTVQFLIRQGLMELVDESEYLLTECGKMVGSETAGAERVRRYRENKALQCNTGVTDMKHIGNVEKEIEIEKDKDEEKNNILLTQSSEKQTSAPKKEADVEAVILNDGSEWRPDEALFAEYVRLYPGVDVKQQFNEMRAWCLGNPEKRKTRRGVRRFVNTWLSKAQDKASAVNRPAQNWNGTSGYNRPPATQRESLQEYAERGRRWAESE